MADKAVCGNRWKYGKDVCTRESGHTGPHRTTPSDEVHTFRWFGNEGVTTYRSECATNTCTNEVTLGQGEYCTPCIQEFTRRAY